MNQIMSPTFSQKTPSFQIGQVLGRKEAQSRLRKLKPGCEEHDKLQAALIKTSGIIEVSLFSNPYKVNTLPESKLLGGFGASEHIAIGKEIKLKGLNENTTLFIKGVSAIQFWHIVALAGDFYGVANEAISLPGGTDDDKTKRFLKAFNTLYEADHDELRRILLELEEECAAVEYSGLPHHCYSSHLMEKNRAIKKIKSDVDALLIDNSDHFSANARDAYRIGHALALKEAQKAGQRKDLEGLKRAYALEAFACHYLTDLFSAGHIRNQRGALESFLITQLKFKEKIAKTLAGLLTGAQHEKDGNEGLNVANKKGEQWRSYGDGNFFSPKSKENKEKVIFATQQSVDEIYNAYNSPTDPNSNSSSSMKNVNPSSLESSSVNELIPFATALNPFPLYSIEGTSLFLHQVSSKIEIKTQQDFLTKGIEQALRYLPQEYIDSYLTPLDIKIPPLISKVIIPQIERLTGSVWHIIGLATYQQARQENQQLNEKIDEMASTSKTTYDNSVKILQEIGDIKDKLNLLLWDKATKEIQEPIATIKDIIFQYKSYGVQSNVQLEAAEGKLWDAHVRLLRVFCEGIVDGKKMLAIYETTLKTKKLTPSEIKVLVTIWFRQMIDYQVQAFSLYATSHVMRNSDYQNLIMSQLSNFQLNLIKQLEANKDHIDDTLVYRSPSYIELQLKKSEIKRLAFSNNSNSNAN